MLTITERLKRYNTGLLPDMLQIKYKLMAENVFRFYRGSCHIFYQDLAKAHLPEAPATWICGDLHLENFGSYKADNRLVHFDLNDFDEAILAPCSWELARIICSIIIAFRHLDMEERKATNMAQLFLKTYSNTLSKGKALYIETKTATGIVKTFLERAASKKRKRLLHKRTNIKKNDLTLMLEHPRHMGIDEELKRRLTDHIQDWITNGNDGPYNYEVCDAAFRLAGTGSVGLKRYAFLLKSRRIPGKYLLVDMKQARASCLTPYVGIEQPAWQHEAERIVAIQQRMQNIQPALLSHTIFEGEPYLIQEMQPVKDSINFGLIKDRYRDIYQVIYDMAVLTASSQLRSGGRQGSATADELITFGCDTTWQDSILQYATNYADAMLKYYQEFRVALKKKAFK